MTMQTPFFTTIFLGNITKSVTVGRKRVLTMSVPDYYLSKKNKKPEVDIYQINLFDNDASKISKVEPNLESYLEDISNGNVLQNMEVDVKISMSKTYKNNKGVTVFPHPEFKMVGLRPHDFSDKIDVRNQSSELEEDIRDLSMPF